MQADREIETIMSGEPGDSARGGRENRPIHIWTSLWELIRQQ